MAEQSKKKEMVVRGLDFFDIRNNLKSFLRDQSQFKDYNFEGASLGVLLDILSYNTHYNSFYSNMALNESFLDTATIRDSVVSLAKQIGYTPRSSQGSETLVDMQITAPTDVIVEGVLNRTVKVKKYDFLKSSLDQDTFYFYVTDTVDFEQERNGSSFEYWARNVRIRQGVLKVATFVVDKSNQNQRFMLNDEGVDTRSIEIKVQTSRTSTEGITENWFRAQDINLLDGQTNAFFVQEIYEGKYEIYFGDGIVGRALDHGNLVTVAYSVTNGPDSNDLGRNETDSNPTFSYTPGEISSPIRVFLKKDSSGRPVPTSGGADRESIESIKFNAPKFYQAQDRVVTVNDYISYLSGTYANSFRSVYVWGGEENIPPQYGKVFISVRPQNSLRLSTSEKISLEENISKSRSIVSVTPRIVDPEYIFIIPSLSIKYKKAELNVAPDSLKAAIYREISRYNDEELSVFDKNFYSSNLIGRLIEVHPSIRSCSMTIILRKYFAIIPSTKFTYNVNFSNKLNTFPNEEYYLSSTNFRTNDKTTNNLVSSFTQAFIRDDGSGKLSLFKAFPETTNELVLNKNQGIIDYETGNITIKDITIYPEEGSLNNEIFLDVIPNDIDIVSKRNNILQIEMSGVTINLSEVS